jgi:hypothetical protein
MINQKCLERPVKKTIFEGRFRVSYEYNANLNRHNNKVFFFKRGETEGTQLTGTACLIEYIENNLQYIKGSKFRCESYRGRQVNRSRDYCGKIAFSQVNYYSNHISVYF